MRKKHRAGPFTRAARRATEIIRRYHADPPPERPGSDAQWAELLDAMRRDHRGRGRHHA